MPPASQTSPAQAQVNVLAPMTLNGWMRYDTVSRLMPEHVRDVLEIGSGVGAFGVRLAERYNYLGLEPDRGAYEKAASRADELGRREFRNLAVEDLPPGQFDLVCAFEVLEHMEDDEATIKAWSKHLRPGGYLLLSVPAHQRLFSVGDELMGHFRRYDPPVMADLLARSGFTDITMKLYGFPLCDLLDTPREFLRRRSVGKAEQTLAERTAASGRVLMPSGRYAGALTQTVTAPFRVIQRGFPRRGTGLAVRAQLA